MKAVVIEEFGGPEVLRLKDAPEPAAARGEIVIRVHSVSVNRTLDCVVRAGKYPVIIKMPHVLGVDAAGEVVETGAAGTNPADVEKALAAAGQGRIRSIHHQLMPLSAAVEAHRIVESNQLTGKIVLEPTRM